MYADDATFVITNKGLETLKNNDLPPSVFTSILKLADGAINYQTFKIFLKEHGDIHPLFAFLHDEAMIALSTEIICNEHANSKDIAVLIAPKAIARDDDIPKKPFDAEKLRKLGHDYVSANHPHMLIGVMAMLNGIASKEAFLDQFDRYSRLIASDTVNSAAHIAEVLSYLT